MELWEIAVLNPLIRMQERSGLYLERRQKGRLEMAKKTLDIVKVVDGENV